MCPSYRVTREEMHSTRGRARLLFEMLRGDPLTDGWRSDSVKEALDLCLACKGCKGDCPVQVDMATYKAEFLSHFYKGRVRPRQAYAMGLIYWWARLASFMPNVANFFTQTPVLGTVMKLIGGIAPQRQMPVFAQQTFTQWFHFRAVRNQDKPQVILWPDTFNNHFFPQVGQAAVEVLEDAGYQVLLPSRSLCCGRPLYDFGMLDLAEHMLRQILTTLRPQIQAGVPVVGLEPSCVAVFRDELINLFPNDEDAKRLSKKTYLLSEFLGNVATHYQPPQLHQKAIVHGHCHQKALMGLDADKKVLAKLGLDAHVLDSGCCGMAGSFGFEDDHYEVSRQVGELVLLPAVREASAETMIIADGFSCREQIAQTTDRQALHLAQVMQAALHQHADQLPQIYPEQHVMKPPRPAIASTGSTTAALIGFGVVAVGFLIWRRNGRNRRQKTPHLLRRMPYGNDHRRHSRDAAEREHANARAPVGGPLRVGSSREYR